MRPASSPESGSQAGSNIVVAIVVALAYLLVAALSRALAGGPTETVPVWLATGMTFGALLAVARGRHAAVLAGTAVAALAWAIVTHRLAPGPAFAFAAIETCSAAAGAWVAARGSIARPLRAVGYLVGGAVLTSALGATLALELWRWFRPGVPYLTEWGAWTFSTLVGILLVAPVIAAFRGFAVKRSGGMPMLQFAIGATAFALFLIIAWIVFAGDVGRRFGPVGATLGYLPMPFLMFASLLWGMRGGALATLCGSLLVIGLTAAGGGPFSVAEGTPGEAVIEVQAYIAVWAVLILIAHALAEARRNALASARDWQLRYERTLEATGVASAEFDAITGAAVWGESAGAVLGADVVRLGSIGEWLMAIDNADRAAAQAGWDAVAGGTSPSSVGVFDVRIGDRPLWVEARLAPVHGADGAVERVVCLMRAIAGAHPRADGSLAPGASHG